MWNIPKCMNGNPVKMVPLKSMLDQKQGKSYQNQPADIGHLTNWPPDIISQLTCAIHQNNQLNECVKMSHRASSQHHQQPNKTPLITQKEQIKELYGDVFEVIKCFPGKPYHINLDESVTPVQTRCRPVPVHLKEVFKQEISKMLDAGILKPVEKATPWINSFVLVESKNPDGSIKLRICLNLTNLNKAVIHEPYCSKQLGHGDDAVVNLLKATMPTKLYGTLYGHNNLPQLCTMLKDIYACKPQAATSSTTTTLGASAPFTMIKALPRTPELTLEDKLTHLTDTFYRMDIDSKSPKKPFKPFITPPHRRFRGSFDKGRSGKGGQFSQFRQFDRRSKFTSNRGRFRPRQPFEKFDKSPNNKRP